MKDAARGWLAQAAEDLQYARSALGDGYFAWACFACQQAAEKALKAILVEHEGRVEKTHRLLHLVSRCETINPQFTKLRPVLDVLNQYYGPTRYADLHGGDAPSAHYTKAMAQEALQLSSRVLAFVRKDLRRAE